jgi:hypothetical protein
MADFAEQTPWLVVMHGFNDDPFKVSIRFRIPKEEDPKAFEECLRAAALVGGKLEVLLLAKNVSFWELYIKMAA